MTNALFSDDKQERFPAKLLQYCQKRQYETVFIFMALYHSSGNDGKFLRSNRGDFQSWLLDCDHFNCFSGSLNSLAGWQKPKVMAHSRQFVAQITKYNFQCALWEHLTGFEL
jgi:hypothetical protein